MNEDFFSRVRGFYRAHRQDLFTYALSLTRDRTAAEDAVQAAFCRLLRRGRPPKDLRPYVFRCVRNASLDQRALTARHNGAPWGGRRGEPGGDGILDISRAGSCGRDPLILEELERCLARLPDDEREAVVLKAVDGLTFREIAAVRRRSIHTVSSWYRRGLARLRDMMAADERHRHVRSPDAGQDDGGES